MRTRPSSPWRWLAEIAITSSATFVAGSGSRCPKSLRDGVQLIESLSDQIPHALDRIANRLPQNFPEDVFDAMSRGMRDAAKHIASEPDQKC
jgi:hypothetical protein